MRRRLIIVTVSQQLENFLNFYTNSKVDYIYAKEQLNKCQDYTQDILHSLELNNLPYKERCKLMTKLMHCRQDRRYWKDRVEELEPFIRIFDADSASCKGEADRNKRVLNLLREALGAARKVENYHSDRKYRPRIFTVMEESK